jgi:hypothetical protein
VKPAAHIPDNKNYPDSYIETCAPEDYGELIFYLYDRQDRITARLNKKINSLDRRLRQIEEQGQSR